MAAEKTTTRQSKTVKTESKAISPKRRATAAAATTASSVSRPRATSKKTIVVAQKQVTADERLRCIEVAAYYIAEKRGFAGGDPAQDWAMAEQQVDSLLLAGRLPA
jgi:hypothetical protein